jgi:hypothetical protein
MVTNDAGDPDDTTAGDNMMTDFYTVSRMDDNDSEFGIFHKLVYEAIMEWALHYEAKMNNTWMT